MKTIKNVLIALVLTFSVSLMANNEKEGEKKVSAKAELKTEISNLLNKPSFTVENTVNAKVHFILNTKNEFVVLKIDNSTPSVEAYIKSNLNYVKISTSKMQKNKTYVLPLVVKKG